MREAYFETFRPLGMLHPSHSSREAIFSKDQDPVKFQGLGAELNTEDAYRKALHEAHETPQYEILVQHPALRNFVRHLTGWEKEFLLPRTMLRRNVPGAAATVTHYDKIFLRGGSADFLTAWVPIGKSNIIISLD